MKMICIGRNYHDHIKELSNSVPTEPMFFMKPDTAQLRNNEDFYIPEFSQDLQYETEVVVKINRVVKSIDRKFASRCYTEVGIGIDFTARDLQRKCAEAGRPWEIAKSFDKSAPVPNDFIPLDELGGDVMNLNFRMTINGEERQRANTSEMIFDVDTLIEHVSKYVTLKIGDLIFTGTPSGVGKVNIGDHLEAWLEDRKLLDFYIR